MHKIKNILWIDRGSKYIWLAYVQEGEKVPFPIGYLLNDKMTLFSFADIVARHNIKSIVIWYPQRQKNIQEKIDAFIKSLAMVIDPQITFTRVDEDYTSVQSWEIVSNFKKNVAEDTVSAMVILERWIRLVEEAETAISKSEQEDELV